MYVPQASAGKQFTEDAIAHKLLLPVSVAKALQQVMQVMQDRHFVHAANSVTNMQTGWMSG